MDARNGGESMTDSLKPTGTTDNSLCCSTISQEYPGIAKSYGCPVIPIASMKVDGGADHCPLPLYGNNVALSCKFTIQFGFSNGNDSLQTCVLCSYNSCKSCQKGYIRHWCGDYWK